MPTPIPTPTASQIVLFAEIAMIDADSVLSLVSQGSSQDISDAKWALTVADLASWSTIGTDAGDIKRVDSIEFFEGAAANTRLNLRNTLRQRYGLPILLDETGNIAGAESITSLKWFGGGVCR